MNIVKKKILLSVTSLALLGQICTVYALDFELINPSNNNYIYLGTFPGFPPLVKAGNTYTFSAPTPAPYVTENIDYMSTKEHQFIISIASHPDGTLDVKCNTSQCTISGSNPYIITVNAGK